MLFDADFVLSESHIKGSAIISLHPASCCQLALTVKAARHCIPASRCDKKKNASPGKGRMSCVGAATPCAVPLTL